MWKTIWIPLILLLPAGGYAPAQTAPASNAPPTSMVISTNISVLPSNLTGYVPDDKKKLRVGDIIAFQINEDHDPARRLTVADSGEVDVPWIGRVAAADKTCKQLAADCKTELEKDYYYKATVIVALETANPFWGRVYVWGAVKNQGALDLAVKENLKASQAILRAGGFAEFADQKAVKLVRANSTKPIILNMVDIIKKGKTEKDVVLQPDDSIIVEQGFVNF
jgi:protein involved in polysaccharide export with SLBB domain